MLVPFTGRTHPKGPFFFVGSFERFPNAVQRVRVVSAQAAWEAATTERGWVCLLPSNARGRATVVWLDAEGRERDSAGHDGPPIEDSGTLGPTFYGPPVSEGAADS